MANLLSNIDIATLFLGPRRDIRRFNDPATRLFKLSEADIGRPFDHIARRFEDPGLKRDIEDVLLSLRSCESEVRCKKGQRYLRRITPYRTADGRIDGVVLTFTDITPLKQAENDLRTSEARLRELIDQASDGIFITDLDGRYTDVNNAGCTMLGYTRAEILGKTIADLIPKEDVDRLWQTRDKRLKGGVDLTEWRIRKKDGTLLPIEVSAKILSDGRWVAFARNIAERRQRAAALEEEARQRQAAEAALRREHNFVETVLNTQAALVVAADTRLRIQVFNKACEATTGYKASELRKDPDWFKRLIPPEEQEAVQAVLEALLDGCPTVVHENHFRHRDGSLHLIRWIGTSSRDDAGRVQYIIGTGIDITEQAEAEEEARSHLEEASRLQRLHTANELATMLAHEINQPLASIATLAEVMQQMLQRPQLDRDKLTKNLETISREALRAGEIIRHLRGFMGRDRIEPAPMEVNAVVRSASAMMTPKAQASGIELELDLSETPLPVMGVPVQIEQVLLNLVLNAIDAIRDAGIIQGRITVETKRVEDMAVAQVSVRDTGPGIQAEDAGRLFEPLVTTKDYGLGVGLRISRSLVEAHGGRLWAEPRVPGGIFHFVLPLAPHSP